MIKLFKILRIIKLAKKFKGIETLVNTILYAIPDLVNAFGLFFVFML